MQGGLNYDPGSGKGRSQPNNGGGEFISVHLRRADYIQARPGIIIFIIKTTSNDEYCQLLFTILYYIGAVPSLKGAAKQLNILKKELNLNKVFLASDAPEHGRNDVMYIIL